MPCPKFNKEKAQGALEYVNKFFQGQGHPDLVSFIEESDKYLQTLSKKEKDSIQQDVRDILAGAKSKSPGYRVPGMKVGLRKSMRHRFGGMRGGATADARTAAIDAATEKLQEANEAVATINALSENERPAAAETAAKAATEAATAAEAVLAAIPATEGQEEKAKIDELISNLKAKAKELTDTFKKKAADEGGQEEADEVAEQGATAPFDEAKRLEAIEKIKAAMENLKEALAALEPSAPAVLGGSGQMPQGPQGRGFVRGMMRVAATLILPRTRTGLVYSAIWLAIICMVGYSGQNNLDFFKVGITQITDGSCLGVSGMFDFTRHPLCTGWRMIVMPIIEGANELYGWKITGLAKMLSGVSIATAVPLTVEATIYELAFHTDYFITTVLQAFYGRELLPPMRDPGRRTLPQILSLASNMVRPGHSVPLLYSQQPVYSQPIVPQQFMPMAQAQPIPFGSHFSPPQPAQFAQGFPQGSFGQSQFPFSPQAFQSPIQQAMPQYMPQQMPYQQMPYQQMPYQQMAQHSQNLRYQNQGMRPNMPGAYFQNRHRSRSRHRSGSRGSTVRNYSHSPNNRSRRSNGSARYANRSSRNRSSRNRNRSSRNRNGSNRNRSGRHSRRNHVD